MTGLAGTPELVYHARRNQEVANLRALKVALDATAEEATQSIRDRFGLQIDSCLRDLATCATDSASLRDTLASEIRPVVAEVRAYLQGVLYRRSGLDNGVGALAHRVLNDIAVRAGVHRQVLLTIGEAEYIENTFGIIRMRQQDASVWRLPILVHELGHHVARHLTSADGTASVRFPVTRWIEDTAGTAREHKHLHELFADVFATYVLGSAYPTCVIVQQAQPEQGLHEHTDTHPSWPMRVHTMIGALRAMSTIDAASRPFAYMSRADVEPLWAALLGEGTPSPAEDELRAAHKHAAEMVDLLVRTTPPGLRFGFGPSSWLVQHLTATAAADAPVGTTCAQVLDATWRWRARNLAAAEPVVAVAERNARRWSEAAAG